MRTDPCRMFLQQGTSYRRALILLRSRAQLPLSLRAAVDPDCSSDTLSGVLPLTVDLYCAPTGLPSAHKKRPAGWVAETSLPTERYIQR